MGSPKFIAGNTAARLGPVALRSLTWKCRRLGFIGHRVFPVIEAAKAGGTFGRIPLEQLLKMPETRRAPGAGYARGKWTFEPASYATEEERIRGGRRRQ